MPPPQFGDTCPARSGWHTRWWSPLPHPETGYAIYSTPSPVSRDQLRAPVWGPLRAARCRVLSSPMPVSYAFPPSYVCDFATVHTSSPLRLIGYLYILSQWDRSPP